MRHQPIEVAQALRLRPLGGDSDVEAAWPWYQDTETVRLVDGPDGEPYSRDQVALMHRQLSTQGEVYIIEERTAAGTWVPIGDVTLAQNTLPIVLRRESRGRGIGRLVLGALIARARDLGWTELQVREIQPGNAASTALFRGAGFVANALPPPAMTLDLTT